MARKKKAAVEAVERKSRNWATVVYPESAPTEWQNVIDDWHCPVLVSPLHDCDTNPGGEVKKEHYHVLVMWDGPRTEALTRSMFAEIGGVGCECVQSIRGYGRYLCHLDNPEKHQYNTEDVREYGGANYQDIISLDTDRRKAVGEMMAFCTENGIIHFRQLCDYARLNKPDWWYALTTTSTMIMVRYLQSYEHELDLERRQN